MVPDGRSIYFTRYLGQFDKGPNYQFAESCGSIFRVGRDGSNEVRITNAPWKDSFHSHFAPTVSPDGTRIAFTDADQCSGGTTSYALRVIDRSGHTTNDLGLLPGNAYYPVNPEYGGPAWSPDGSRLAFFANDVLNVAYRDGSGRRRVTPANAPRVFLEVNSPAWSPDGRWIAFTTSERSDDLYVIRPDGTRLRRLTRSKAAEKSPSWIERMPGL